MTIRRILIWLSVGCLTFLAGITLSYLWLVHSLPEPSLDEPMRTSVSSTGRAAEPKIVGGMDACGPTANYHTYTLSDGTSISTSCEHFRSAKRADEELRKKLKEVTEIIHSTTEKKAQRFADAFRLRQEP